MPQSPTPSMLLVQPSENGDAGVWDTLLTALFLLVDGHDHSTGKGVKVKTNGLDINADLTFSSGGSYFAAKDLKAVDMQPQAASSMTSYAGALFVNSTDSNNLYFRTEAGSNVRITNGASLDVVGSSGIAGDYASVLAEVRFDDATDSYWFRQQTGGGAQQFARMRCGDVDLFEFKAHPTAGVPTNRVRLASPAGLGASYTVTFAGAVPGSTQMVQISSAGTLTYSNTVANAVTLSGGIANNVTLTLGATAAANQHVTVSGTGRHKHGDQTLTLAANGGTAGVGAIAVNTSGEVASAASGNTWYMTVPIDIGKRIRSVTFQYARGGGTLTFTVARISSGTGFTIGSTTSAAGSGFATITVSSLDYTVASTEVIYLKFESGSATDILIGATVLYDHP